MATCTITFDVGYGAESPYNGRALAVSYVTMSDNGSMLITTEPEAIFLAVPHTTHAFTRGKYLQTLLPNGVKRYVQVPATTTAFYSDLVSLDPATLTPAASPEAAWWAASDANVVDGAVVGDDLILTHYNGATTNAGRVTGALSDPDIAALVPGPSATATALDGKYARPRADIDLNPLLVETLSNTGCGNEAPGARTGLATTQYSGLNGMGETEAQGWLYENIATGVSGTAGAYTLTVTDTTTLNTLNGAGSVYWDAVVESSDGRTCTVSVLSVSGTTVNIVQPLPFDIAGGRIASRVDEVSGQHLTTIGTKELAQHVAAANPLLGTRGAIRDGAWDTLPPSSRVVWAKNAALTSYGSSSSASPVVVSDYFDQPAGNNKDTTALIQRPGVTSNGPRIGTHATGHGIIATFRPGRTPAIIEFATSTLRGTASVTTARIRVTATLVDGTVIYDKTVGGGNMVWHRIPTNGAEAVTVEATNVDGGIYYLNAMHSTLRDTGVGTKLTTRKALLLGDSWVTRSNYKLGTELSTALAATVVSFGAGGHTTDWGIAWLDYALAANPGCDTVIVHFYTNDLNNNQSTTMTLPYGGGTAAMWPNGLTAAQAEARWITQIRKLVSMIQQRGLRPVVILPGGVGITKQAPAAIHYEQPALKEWFATSGEATSATSYLNTVGKVTGKVVFIGGKPLYATGSTPTSTWVDAAGTVVHTPA